MGSGQRLFTAAVAAGAAAAAPLALAPHTHTPLLLPPRKRASRKKSRYICSRCPAALWPVEGGDAAMAGKWVAITWSSIPGSISPSKPWLGPPRPAGGFSGTFWGEAVNGWASAVSGGAGGSTAAGPPTNNNSSSPLGRARRGVRLLEDLEAAEAQEGGRDARDDGGALKRAAAVIEHVTAG